MSDNNAPPLASPSDARGGWFVGGEGVSSTEREIQSSVCSIDRICYQNSLSSNPLIRVTVRPIRRLTPPPTITYLAAPHNPLARQNSITHYCTPTPRKWQFGDVRRRNSVGNRNNCGSPVLEGDEGKGNRPITGRKCHPLMGWHFNPSATTAPLTVSSSWFQIIYESCCLYVSPLFKWTKSLPSRNKNCCVDYSEVCIWTRICLVFYSIAIYITLADSTAPLGK